MTLTSIDSKNIYLTGSTGFVGRCVHAMLLKEGFNVTCGNRELDYSESLEEIDCVIHLAAKVHDFNENSYKPYHESNVLLTEKLLKRAINSNVKKFIFLSSIKVNGEESTTPYSEAETRCPDDPYGRSKWEAEQVVRSLCSEGDTSFTILRPPLVFGPNVKANFNKLIRLALKPIPLPFGSIQEKRSFIYIENLSDIILRCIDSKGSDNKTFLIKDDSNLSTQELISSIRDIYGSNRLIFKLPLPLLKLIFYVTGQKKIYTRVANGLTIDDSAIREHTGWVPPTSTRDALKATILAFCEK